MKKLLLEQILYFLIRESNFPLMAIIQYYTMMKIDFLKNKFFYQDDLHNDNEE